MIHLYLKRVADEINAYLGSFYDSQEPLAEVNSIQLNANSEVPNRIVISLCNIERETGVGVKSNQPGDSSKGLKRAESYCFNLHFILAAVFDEKRYTESLEKLSTAIECIQANRSLWNTYNNRAFTVEIVNLTFNELNSIWSIMGGHHYPALIGKIRMIEIDSEQVRQISTSISKAETVVGLGK